MSLRVRQAVSTGSGAAGPHAGRRQLGREGENDPPGERLGGDNQGQQDEFQEVPRQRGGGVQPGARPGGELHRGPARRGAQNLRERIVVGDRFHAGQYMAGWRGGERKLSGFCCNALFL